MNNTTRRTIIFILLATVLLGSCAGQPPPSPTPDIDAILTESIGTLSAAFFETQTALVPPATNTPLPTVTPLSTNTPLALPSPVAPATQAFFATSVVFPTVTGTIYTPTLNPTSLAYGCNNLGLINDLPLSSASTMQPGQSFTKEWQVANTGTCEWTLGYRLIFVSGNAMEGNSTRPNNPIGPGKWTKLHVNLTAPNKEGTYSGYWKLSDGAGNTFGATLGVTITVKKPTYP
jgi:hypothetical protein